MHRRQSAKRVRDDADRKARRGRALPRCRERGASRAPISDRAAHEGNRAHRRRCTTRQAAARDRHRVDRQHPARFRDELPRIVRSVPELLSLRASGADGISLRELAQDVHRETSKVRRRKLYLVTLLALFGLWLLWPWLSPKQRGAVDAKNYPAWAGLTPLDVDALWPQACGAAPPDQYLRAVSTGPASPLIVAATTVGGELAHRLLLSDRRLYGGRHR